MRNLAPLWATLAALLLVGAPVTAQVSGNETDSQTKQVTLVAQESGCPDDKTFCFSVEESPSNLSEGDEVNLTLRNPDGNRGDHNVHVTMNESADPEHQDTSSEDAIAKTPTIAPGETASTNFTVPDGEALYLWCDRTGHEAGGMWTTIELQANNGTEGNATFGNDTDENETRDNDSSENDTFRNDTNESDENDTFRNDTDENETQDNETNESENESEENETTQQDRNRERNPLQPTEGDDQDGGEGERQSPIGLPVLLVSFVIGAAVVQIVGRDT